MLARAHPTAVSTSNASGFTPLHTAIMEAPELVPLLMDICPEAAQTLVDGDFPESGHPLGQTPLHLACAVGNVPLVESLLAAHPAAARVESATGLLPHHYAARTGQLAALQALVAVHPDGLRHEDQDGVQPFDEAYRCAAKAAKSAPPQGSHESTGNPTRGLTYLDVDGEEQPIHPRDELLAFLIAHDMPVTMDGTRPPHGQLFCTSWDLSLFLHHAAGGADEYCCAAALALVLGEEGGGGYGFSRRAHILHIIATRAVKMAKHTLHPEVECVLTRALSVQAPEDRVADVRSWRTLRRAFIAEVQAERQRSEAV